MSPKRHSSRNCRRNTITILLFRWLFCHQQAAIAFLVPLNPALQLTPTNGNVVKQRASRIFSSKEDTTNKGTYPSTTNITISLGDPVREATGIRPSLHPTVINAIADALKARAVQNTGLFKTPKGEEETMVFRVSDTVQPLEVALTAGRIASTAISKRQESSKRDGMKLTLPEEQTIAGRIIGVIMRLDDLEVELYSRVSSVDWVSSYDEWGTFGVLQGEDSLRSKEKSGQSDAVDRKILDDPLFAVTRAECILALFLHHVETPQLQLKNEFVPDNSTIDFLDDDRSFVILSESQHLSDK